MNLSEIYQSKYLRAADLDGKEVTVEIEKVVMETFPGEERPKPVLIFKGRDKGLVLNVTNARVIAKHYGDETRDWAGRTVVLISREVDFKGDTVEAIRIKVPIVEAPQPVKAEAPLDDAVPF